MIEMIKRRAYKNKQNNNKDNDKQNNNEDNDFQGTTKEEQRHVFNLN